MKEIKLSKDKGNYYYDDNMDDDAIEEYKSSTLTPNPPIIIFDRNISDKFNYSRYKYIIETILEEQNQTWNSIVKIIIEDRFERERERERVMYKHFLSLFYGSI
jgi:hypothetical protein